jgi:lambda family phage minor tail protein L
MSVIEGLTTELQKLAPSAIIELFELDCSVLGGEVLRFHAGTNQLSQNIVWAGNTYTRFPVKVSGFEFTGQGQFPRPKLSVSNLFSAITLLNMSYGDLLRAKITRIRTMQKYLDAVNFTGGVNASADPSAQFESDIFYIDRKSFEDRDVVEYELASACELVGVSLPRRQIVQNVCPWVYRSAECSYAGPPVVDINDEAITSASSAAGQLVLDKYALYLTAKASLTVKEAALSAASQTKDSACAYQETSSTYTFTPPVGYAYPTPTNGVIFNEYLNTTTAYFGGVVVALGSTYVQGEFQENYFTGYVNFRMYAIEVWGVGATCSAKTTLYTAALAARDAAKTASDAAYSTYQSAFSALPDNDPLYTDEKCGKRLSSCKLRFGENEELSFGSFPSVGLFR